MIINNSEENIVKISKALSDKTRLKMLEEISKRGSICCGDAESIAGLSQPTVSHHLKILTEAGLLNAEKNGRHVKITVNKESLINYKKLLSDSMNK